MSYSNISSIFLSVLEFINYTLMPIGHKSEYETTEDQETSHDVVEQPRLEQDRPSEIKETLLPELSSLDIADLSKMLDLHDTNKLEYLKHPENKAEIIKVLSDEIYDSIKETFVNKIVDQIKDLPEEDRLKTLFALVSSPESVREDQASALMPEGNDNLQRFPTHERGYGVIPAVMNKTRELNCAGRSMIISGVLKELNQDHFVASPDSHSLVVAVKGDGDLVYMDAQQGLLVDIPKDAIKWEGDLNQGATATLDVKKLPPAKQQGLGMIHKSFILAQPEVGIVNQVLNNAITASHDQWIDQEMQDDLYNHLGPLRDKLFPHINKSQNIDSGEKRVGELVTLFEQLGKDSWKVSDASLILAKGLEVYPLGDQEADRKKNLETIVEDLKGWRSRGDKDEVAQMLSRITGKPNKEGVGLEYFFENNAK